MAGVGCLMIEWMGQAIGNRNLKWHTSIYHWKKSFLSVNLYWPVAKPIYKLGYGLDDRGSIRGRGSDGIFSSPPHPERLWDPPSLLSNEHRGSFQGWRAAGAWSWSLISI